MQPRERVTRRGRSRATGEWRGPPRATWRPRRQGAGGPLRSARGPSRGRTRPRGHPPTGPRRVLLVGDLAETAARGLENDRGLENGINGEAPRLRDRVDPG